MKSADSALEAIEKSLLLIQKMRPSQKRKYAEAYVIINGSYIDSRLDYKGRKYRTRAIVEVVDSGLLSLLPIYLKSYDDENSLPWTFRCPGEPIATEIPIRNTEEAEETLYAWAVAAILLYNTL